MRVSSIVQVSLETSGVLRLLGTAFCESVQYFVAWPHQFELYQHG